MLEKQIEKEKTVTSPVTEPEENPGLNNATVPTPEQEENAGIAPNPEINAAEVSDEPVGQAEPEPGQTPEQEPAEDPNSTVDPELGIAEASATKTFTQSQVDEIAGKARKEGRDKALKDTFARYGVNSVDELDDLFGDAQRFATSQEELKEKTRAWDEADKARNDELVAVKERVALLESGIDKNRYEDAKLILRGKGLDVTAENIAQELATHPEWKGMGQEQNPTPNHPFRKVAPTLPDAAPNPEPATKISVLGNNSTDNPEPELSERERAMKLFKV